MVVNKTTQSSVKEATPSLFEPGDAKILVVHPYDNCSDMMIKVEISIYNPEAEIPQVIKNYTVAREKRY